LRSPVCSATVTSGSSRVFVDRPHASSSRVISSGARNRSLPSSLAILNTGSLLISSHVSAMRRMDRSSAHSRLTVTGDNFPPRREVVPSRATRYSATRRVVIMDNGVAGPKKSNSGRLRSSSSSIERLPSLRFSVRNFSTITPQEIPATGGVGDPAGVTTPSRRAASAFSASSLLHSSWNSLACFPSSWAV
jgi:hypothetical protein